MFGKVRMKLGPHHADFLIGTNDDLSVSSALAKYGSRKQRRERDSASGLNQTAAAERGRHGHPLRASLLPIIALGGTTMRTKMIPILMAVLAGSASSGESGSVCIAPVPETPDPRSAPGLFCASEKLSLKIDAKAMPWPMKDSARIDALDAAVRHRVVVSCNGKPQQTVDFRFSAFGTAQLCLYLNDLYKTVELQDVKRSPWCRCK